MMQLGAAAQARPGQGRPGQNQQQPNFTSGMCNSSTTITTTQACIEWFQVAVMAQKSGYVQHKLHHPPTLSGLAANMPYQYSQVPQSGRRARRALLASRPVCSTVWPHPYMYNKVKQQRTTSNAAFVCLIMGVSQRHHCFPTFACPSVSYFLSALWVEINSDGSILIPLQLGELFDKLSEEKSKRSEVDL